MAFDKEAFKLQTLSRMQTAEEFWHNWRTEAKDDYAFRSGKQWLEIDEQILRQQKRPPVTFNYSEKMIDAVLGAEVTNRQEVTYLPRNTQDAGVSEVWNAAAKWVRDECDAPDEESDAFGDMLTCGLGWTHTRISYEEDLDGKILIDRVDPLEMWSDPAACKPGLTDRRYDFRSWWIDKTEAERLWPDAVGFIQTIDTDSSNNVIIRGHRYEDSVEGEMERHKDQVQIVLYECVEKETVWRVGLQDGAKEIDDKTFAAARDDLDQAGIKYARQQKRVYYRAFFTGDTLLEVAKSPTQQGFTFTPITGKRDRNKNTWYGVMRVMKDPQRWANKWLSQILHIVNSNAKGGLMAELGAFVDPTKAQEEWSQPDSITLLNQGGIDKIQQKQMPPYPQGLDRLMEFALSSLPMVTGINLEALGLANREQANVLEQSRKQAAYGLLAPLFDALRKYRKVQGRVLLDFIHQYISDGRLIRIGDPANAQYIPLTKQPNAPEYTIIVDDSPAAPDVKDKTWATLMQLVPSMLKAGMPLPPDLLKYSPLPAALSQKWEEFAAQSKQPDPRMQQLQQQLQQVTQQLQAAKSDQQVDMANVQLDQQKTQAELKLRKDRQDQEMALDREKAIAQFQLAELQQRQEFELEARRVAHESGVREQQMKNDFKIKAVTAGINPDTSGNMAISMDTDQLSAAVEKMTEANQQSQANMSAAMQMLAEAMTRPRKIIEDKNGKPIGSEPA